jgi:glucuronate isomerase
MTSLSSELFDEIRAIPCINSHSHMMPEASYLERVPDILSYFAHAYPAADLVCAGMSEQQQQRALTPGLPMDERWRIFEPFWKSIRLTGYSQCISEGIRDLLGFEELNAGTVEPINEALQARARPGLYHDILKRRSNIQRSVVNMDDLVEVDRDFFLPLPRLNRFSMLQSVDGVRAIEKDYDATITSLDSHVELIRRTCQTWNEAQVAGIKLSQSYHRRMDFTRRDRTDAAAIFERLMRGDYGGLDSPEGALLEDYLVFECCRAASEANLTIQFHQGMRAANYGGMEGCSPAPLVELMQTFREARFDLSHAGFPYLQEGAVLGKTFGNVYLNMSWIHIISPIGARNALREWLRMVPYNKIIAFGDDLMHLDAVYGHLQMARRNFAVVLAEMIEDGSTSQSTAMDVARACFHDNPATVYGVDARKAGAENGR